MNVSFRSAFRHLRTLTTVPGGDTIRCSPPSSVTRHLPEDRRARSTWRYVAQQLAEAAAGADTVDVAIALRLVLMLENVECRPA